MSAVESLREFVNERLTAAAQEILRVYEKTIIVYEEEIDRQRRLLDVVWKPEVNVPRIELPQQHVCQEEEVLADKQLCTQERNSSLDQENPEPPQIKEDQEDLWTSEEGELLVLKQETDDFMSTPVYEESDHSEDLPLHHVCKEEEEEEEEEEEVLADKQLCTQERNSSLDPEPPQIKEEQEDLWTSEEGELLVLKQETDDFMSTPVYEDHSEGQTLDSSIAAVEEMPSSYISVRSSVVSEPSSDQQLLSHNSQLAESQDQKGGKPGDSGSTRNTDPQQQNQHHKSSSHTNYFYSPTMSTIQCNTPTGEKTFTCHMCEKVFNYKSKLLSHLKIHTGERPFTCKTCGKDYKYSSTLKVHMRIHTGEKPYTCETCGVTFRSSSTLKVHMRIHTGEKLYTCETCGGTFTSNCSLKVHMRIHTGERPYLCKICGRTFNESTKLTRHMRMHTGEKPYACETCGKHFRRCYRLKVHMRTHTGEKPYPCETCGRRFSDDTILKRHMRIHTAEKLPHCQTDIPAVAAPAQVRRFT